MAENNGLPQGWVTANLEDCVDILDSQRIPINASERADRIEGKPKSSLFPYYGATGQVGWIDDYIFNEELVLLGEDGAPFLDPFKNKAYTIRGKTWVNNHAHVLRAIDGIILTQYLKHYLDTVDYHDFVTGTTRLKLNQSRTRKIPIILPPIPEQQRIVAKIEELFTQLDTGVAELQQAKARLQRYRQAVLKAAVEGELTREWREKHQEELETASELLERILKARREKWVAEGGKGKYKEPAQPHAKNLPALPSNWVWTNLDSLITLSQNGFGKRRSKIGTLTIVLRLADISNGAKISLADVRRIGATDVEIEKYRLFKNDLICIRVNGSPNLVGRFVKFDSAPEVVTFCDHFIRFRLVNPLFASYLQYFCNSQLARRYVDLNKVSSAGQNTVSQTTMKELKVALPPLNEQARIDEMIEWRLSVANEIEEELNRGLVHAERLRQSILKRAFEGRLVPQDLDDEPASVLLNL